MHATTVFPDTVTYYYSYDVCLTAGPATAGPAVMDPAPLLSQPWHLALTFIVDTNKCSFNNNEATSFFS